MKRLRLIEAGLMSAVCCACSSTPVHYYTLLRPTPTPSELTSAACCRVQIRRVVIPREVDRPELVTRSGEDEAMVLSNATWLAPLRDEIRDALTSQIDLKLVQATAVEPAARAPEPVVFVNVTRFESVPAQYVLVSANWRIQRTDLPKATSLTCETTARIAVKSGVSAIVQGYQQAIVKIADQIALDLLDAGRIATRRCTSG